MILKKMKENSTTPKAPRKAGRPSGTTLGAIYLSNAEISEILKRTDQPAPDAEPIALIKVPKFQGGTDGKANSGRLYTPASWNNCPVLLIKLTDQQAKRINAADLRARAEAIENSQDD